MGALIKGLVAQDIARERVYEALLPEPGRSWTVAAMAGRLPDVAINDIRTTLHLLLGDRLMGVEPRARSQSLALGLTGDGERTLAAVLRDWNTR